jgi:hypothetical protein
MFNIMDNYKVTSHFKMMQQEKILYLGKYGKVYKHKITAFMAIYLDYTPRLNF